MEELADQLGLSAEERSELLPSGKQTIITNRVHWAKLYLSKSQLVETTRRGHFRITERGRKVLQSHPAKIDNKFLDQFEEFRQFGERSVTTGDTDGETQAAGLADQKETPDETMRTAYRQIEGVFSVMLRNLRVRRRSSEKVTLRHPVLPIGDGLSS